MAPHKRKSLKLYIQYLEASDCSGSCLMLFSVAFIHGQSDDKYNICKAQDTEIVLGCLIVPDTPCLSSDFDNSCLR